MLEFFGQFAAASVAIAGSFWLGSTVRAGKQRQLRAALVGELMSLYRHYGFVEISLPNQLGHPREVTRLQTAIHGKLYFFENHIADLGFLAEQDIAELMLLSFYVRNNDIYLQYLIDFYKSNESLDQHKASAILPQRFRSTQHKCAELLERITSRKRQLKRVYEKSASDDYLTESYFQYTEAPG